MLTIKMAQIKSLLELGTLPCMNQKIENSDQLEESVLEMRKKIIWNMSNSYLGMKTQSQSRLN